PEPDAFVSDKSVIDGWKIMHTPGHTPGHVALTNGIVAITGDLILADDTSNVAYVPLKGYRPLSSYLRSIVATANLKVDLFLPSHGDVFRDVRQRVSEIFDHHYERLSQAAKALGKGLSSAREVAQQIKWSSGIFQKLSPLEKWLAILETISHLDFLVETGYAVTTSVLNYGVSETADWNAVKSKLTLIADNLWSK
ncbi:MAG: MBL fold metallo-hydrolase, partial [Candidatus Caldarchaeum sp.]|nr:MBL fold metallo-hydrolase [Candidatus Caldarchaeum sp.]